MVFGDLEATDVRRAPSFTAEGSSLLLIGEVALLVILLGVGEELPGGVIDTGLSFTFRLLKSLWLGGDFLSFRQSVNDYLNGLSERERDPTSICANRSSKRLSNSASLFFCTLVSAIFKDSERIKCLLPGNSSEEDFLSGVSFLRTVLGESSCFSLEGESSKFSWT